MYFDYKEDIQGLIRGIAEEVSYANPGRKDVANWFDAKGIIQSNYFKFLDKGGGPSTPTEEDTKVLKFTHELIAARARRLYERNPSSGPVVNWLTAQKDLAVEIYLMDVGHVERHQKIEVLEKRINSELDPLKKYQGI